MKSIINYIEGFKSLISVTLLLWIILWGLGEIAINVAEFIPFRGMGRFYIIIIYIGILPFFTFWKGGFIGSRLPYYINFLKISFVPILLGLLFVNVNLYFVYVTIISSSILFVFIVLYVGDSKSLISFVFGIIAFYSFIMMVINAEEGVDFGVDWMIYLLLSTIILSFISYSFVYDTWNIFKLLFKKKLKLKNVTSYLTNGWKLPLTKSDLAVIINNSNLELLWPEEINDGLITIDKFEFSVNLNESIIVARREIKINFHENNYKCGIISKKGWWLYKPIYYISDILSNGGYYLYRDNSVERQTYFYIDKYGKRLNKLNFDSVSDFINGLAIVAIKKEYGVLKHDGTLILDCKYEKINFINEYFIVAGDSTKRLYNYHGTLLGASYYHKIFIDNKPTIAFFYRINYGINDNVSTAGYIDINGIELVKVEPCEVQLKDNNNEQIVKYRIVKSNGQKTECNYDLLKLVNSSNYDTSYFYGMIGNILYYLDNNLERTRIGEYNLGRIDADYFILQRECEDNSVKISLYNKDSKKLIDTEYNKIRLFEGEIYKVYKNNSKGSCVGLITLNNKLIIDAIYDEIEVFDRKSGLITIVKNDKYGLINYKGKIILPMQYDYWMRSFSNDIIAVCKGDSVGLFNPKSATPPEMIYDYIEFFDEDYAVLKQNNKYGLFSPFAEKIHPCIYDSINFFENYGDWILIKGKSAYLFSNESGSQLKEVSFEDAKKIIAKNE